MKFIKHTKAIIQSSKKCLLMEKGILYKNVKEEGILQMQVKSNKLKCVGRKVQVLEAEKIVCNRFQSFHKMRRTQQNHILTRESKN